MSKIIGATVTTPMKPGSAGGSVEQEGIFEVVRDETYPAIKIGQGFKIIEDNYIPGKPNYMNLSGDSAPELWIRTKDGVNILQISPSKLLFDTGDYGIVGRQGNNNFTLTLIGGKVRTNNAAATDNTFAVGWESYYNTNSYNPFEVISDYNTGKCGIKVGQTTVTEEQLQSMLSILTNNLNEVMF